MRGPQVTCAGTPLATGASRCRCWLQERLPPSGPMHGRPDARARRRPFLLLAAGPPSAGAGHPGLRVLPAQGGLLPVRRPFQHRPPVRWGTQARPPRCNLSRRRASPQAGLRAWPPWDPSPVAAPSAAVILLVLLFWPLAWIPCLIPSECHTQQPGQRMAQPSACPRRLDRHAERDTGRPFQAP